MLTLRSDRSRWRHHTAAVWWHYNRTLRYSRWSERLLLLLLVLMLQMCVNHSSYHCVRCGWWCGTRLSRPCNQNRGAAKKFVYCMCSIVRFDLWFYCVLYTQNKTKSEQKKTFFPLTTDGWPKSEKLFLYKWNRSKIVYEILWVCVFAF